MEVSGAHQLFGYTHILSNILFFVQQKMKQLNQVWNNLRVRVEYDRIFIFGQTVPLSRTVCYLCDAGAHCR